jgi:hypothetical protein
MKDHLRQQFRWAPHLSGTTGVKPKDYEESFTVEADTPYAAWHALKGTERELMVGDVIGTEESALLILKYIGFEQATWILPEPKPAAVIPPSEPAPPAPAQVG